jgi:hypothetical protein
MVNEPSTDGDSRADQLLATLTIINDRQTRLETMVVEIWSHLANQRTKKEWYSTSELAEAMSKSRYTVQERWCNDGRIECEKDSESGKWRIPGDEYRRLVAGGSLKFKCKRR